jgi:uncharacterized protein (TIGR03067 family)
MHPLPSRICGVTLALGLVLACAPPVNAQKALEGTWTATKAERDGKAADDVVGHRLSFASDRFQIQSKDAKSVYAGSFRVDASASPAAIDFDHSEGSLRGKAWKGIYALDGDTLIICDNAEDLDKARPAAFEAKSRSSREAGGDRDRLARRGHLRKRFEIDFALLDSFLALSFSPQPAAAALVRFL